MDRTSGYLFASDDLREMIEHRLSSVRTEVEAINANRLLNTAQADLVQHFVDKFDLSAPTLRRDEWTADEKEVQIDVRHDQNRYIPDRSRPALIPGQRIEIEVPFDGDERLFYARASHFTSVPPRAELRRQSLVLTFSIANDAGQLDVRQMAERVLAEIEQHLQWQRNDLKSLKDRLRTEADRAIDARRKRLLANQGRVSALGIPIKARPDAPKTYVVP